MNKTILLSISDENIQAIDNMTIAVRNSGVSLQDVTQAFVEFSSVLKSLKDRYHPFIYWMFEIGLLK